MQFFAYGQEEIAYLRQQDEKLGTAIDRIGHIEREVRPDVFASLVDCIVSQQISSKAADTVMARLCSLLGDVTPEGVLAADVNAIQRCGITMKKARYIKGVAEATAAGRLDLEGLRALPDAEVIKMLTKLEGIGNWTAEMVLIFSLCRPDVVCYGDLAIRRGMMNLYGLSELPRATFEEYRKAYSPFGSVASLYLWRLSV